MGSAPVLSRRHHKALSSSFASTAQFPAIRRHEPAATMLLGIPRLFGGSGRPKQSEVVQTVEATPPPPQPKEGPMTWVQGHPMRSAAAVSLIVFAAKRALRLGGKGQKASGMNGTKLSTTAAASSGSKRSAPLRAIPKRHETTEEALDLLGNTSRKYIIVGGKGGVGKTSMSAAVATSFADRGQVTLIVSTDPAHSLSDAFGQSFSGGDPVPVMGIDNLYAQEVDPDSMKQTFKMMSQMDGMSGAGLEDMGLDDLNSLFETIPPGFDEAVALVEIIKYIQADSEYARFERIVFDTAPTGHTLRLLALPDFLNGFFGKIISMKSKFGNVMNQFKGMFGASDTDMDDSVQEMEELKRSMNMVRELFRDEVQTEFVVATIPNMMAIAESKRLVEELDKERIPVRHLFINHVQPANDECTFCAARHKEQIGNLRYIEQEFSGLQISTVQSFDKEIKGSAALRAMGSQLFPQAAKSDIDGLSNGSSSARVRLESVSNGADGMRDGEGIPPRAKAELTE